MNEELTQRLVASVDKVAGWVEAAEGLAAEQVPIVADEIIKRGIYTESVDLAACGGIFMLLAGICAWILWEERKSTRNTGDGIVFLIMLGCGFFAATLYQANELISILVAPRLYVLEQLRGLL